MNWAMAQATGDPRAQCLLYVVADTADAEGVAWPSADWMASKSQQSRATVYRRLAQMQELGLLVMFPRYIDNEGKIFTAAAPGRRRTSPEIRLQLGVFLKQTDPPADEDEGAESGDPLSPAETTPVAASDSPVAPERRGSSHCGDSKNHLSNQEENPPTPLAGGCDDDLAALRAVYPIPITDVPKTLSVWAAMTEQERADALLGAKGYADFIAKQRQRGSSRNVKDTHRWLRDRAWLGYLDEGKRVESVARRIDVKEGSPEWAAWDVFYRCCGRSSGIVSSYASGEPGDRTVNVPQQWPPPCGGADIPRDQWKFVFEGSGEFAAWLRRLRDLPDVRIGLSNRQDADGKMKRGLNVPTLWPPRKSDDLAKTG